MIEPIGLENQYTVILERGGLVIPVQTEQGGGYIGGGAPVLTSNPTPSQSQQGAICTMDAKVCADGSTVSRNPARNCAFNDCPTHGKPNTPVTEIVETVKEINPLIFAGIGALIFLMVLKK